LFEAFFFSGLEGNRMGAAASTDKYPNGNRHVQAYFSGIRSIYPPMATVGRNADDRRVPRLDRHQRRFSYRRRDYDDKGESVILDLVLHVERDSMMQGGEFRIIVVNDSHPSRDDGFVL
jgi:hypothetical protein